MRPHVGHHRSRPLQRLLTDCWPSAAGCGRPARPRGGSRSPRWWRGGRAAVSGVEGLQQVGRFGAAHFADDDVIGPVPQGVAHEVADRDGSLL